MRIKLRAACRDAEASRQLNSGRMRWGKQTQLRRGGLAVAALVALGTFLGGSAVAASAPGQVRLPALPGPVVHGKVIGGLASGQRLHLMMVLKPPDPAALRSFVEQVSDPSSAHYRNYLTPGQFGRRFGAPAGEVQSVRRALRAHGLTPGAVAANHLEIPLTATAGQVERAFSLHFERRALAGGTEAVVASAPPALDSQIAPDVQTVLGLTSLGSPRPLLVRPALGARAPLVPGSAAGAAARPHVVTGGPQPCSAASSTAGQDHAYTADQIASAYGFAGLYAAGDQGQGVTIAEYELEPYDSGDVTAYQSCYGTHASVSNVTVDGGAGTGQGSGEAALDIENAIGLAPRADFLVYEGPNASQTVPGSGPYDLLSAIVNQDRANVISISWGYCEQIEGGTGAEAENTLFEQAAAQGQSVLAADGDNGSEDCNGSGGVPDPQLAVDDPSSQPFVTGVGGTSLGSLGPPPAEAVWNGGGNPTGLFGLASGASGGGVSGLWSMPGYQSGAPSGLNVINQNSSRSSCGASSGYCREVPDVAANADPNTGYVFYFNGSGAASGPQGWQAVGGTSAASPVWAALLAVADASSACHGSPVGFANPALYDAAASGYAADFHDVTSGNNDFTGTNGGRFPAAPGYDMATGLGSPNAAPLAAALCADALRIRDPGPQTSIVGSSVRLQLRITGLLSGTPSYLASGLPPGLTLSRSVGRITGRPKKAGNYVVAVVVLDGTLAVRGVAFNWTIEGAPRAWGASLTGTAAGRPRLRITVRSGANAPGLGKLTFALPAGLRFAGAHAAVTGAGGRHLPSVLRIRNGRLILALFGAPRQVTLAISYPAIRPTVNSRIRSGRRLVMGLAVSDANHHAVTIRIRVRVRS